MHVHATGRTRTRTRRGADAARRRSAAALLLAGLLPVAAWAAEDLDIARAALADRLHALAERHLVRVLERERERPADCVPALLLLCRLLAEQGRHAELLEALESRPEVVRAGLDAGGFAFWRAGALLATGRAREVLACIEQAGNAGIDPAYAIGLRRLDARARVSLGDLAGALAAFAVIDTATTNADLRAENLLEWARAALQAGQDETGLGLLRQQAELGVARPAVAAGALLRAAALRKGRRDPEAEQALLGLAREAAASVPLRAEAWVELAALAAAAGRTNDTLTAGRQAVELAAAAPDAVDLRLRCGRILLRTPGLLAEGAGVLRQAIRERPEATGAADAQMALADAWLQAGSNELAVAEYRRYLETYGDPARAPAAWRGQAWGLFRQGSYGEAATLFQRAAAALSNAVERSECLFKAADALHADRRYEQAVELYRQVARDAPDADTAARASFMAADALERLGAIDAAEAAFAALAPPGATGAAAIESLLRLAALRERRGATDEAVATYSRVVDATTNRLWRGQARLGRGRAHYRVYRFTEAVEDFTQAQLDVPELAAEAAYLNAMALYGAGRDEEAWRACEAFAARYPDSPLLPEARLWMAKYQYNRQVFDAAQALFLDCVTRWPQRPGADAALLWAGRAAFRRSEYPDTVEILARLARDYPASARLAEARVVQADALCELARFEEAILVLDEVINRHPESEWVTIAWGRRGDALFSLGAESPRRYEEALQAYAVVVARPDVTPELSLQAAYKTGRCLEKLQRPEEAFEQYYTQVLMRFLRERREGVWHGTSAQRWFSRTALQAADLLEARGDFEAAVRVLQRVEQAEAPGREEARARIERITADHRWTWQAPRRPATEEEEP